MMCVSKFVLRSALTCVPTYMFWHVGAGGDKCADICVGMCLFTCVRGEKCVDRCDAMCVGMGCDMNRDMGCDMCDYMGQFRY